MSECRQGRTPKSYNALRHSKCVSRHGPISDTERWPESDSLTSLCEWSYAAAYSPQLEATAILRESGVAPSGRMSFDTFRTR